MLNIVTWNINGIRSIQKSLKDLFDSLNADIICLQETKITRDMLDEPTALVDGYTSYYSFSRKKSGYSGVATYCKPSCTPCLAEEGLTGILTPCNDSIGYNNQIQLPFTDDELEELDNEGRCVMTCHKFKENDKEVNLIVINVYCPNAGENDERLTYKLQYYKALNLRCLDLLSQGYRVIVLGDMNVSHRLIDHCEPEDILNFSKTPSRVWFNSFLCDGGGNFIDTFRRLYPDREKSFTCWNTKLNARLNNYGTRIDYILINSELSETLIDCIIMSDVYGSDHCPVKAVLNINVVPSVKCPALCTKNFKEFSGKQLKISTFVCKRSLTEETSSCESESKKLKLSQKKKQQQSNLLKFFVPKNANTSTEETLRPALMISTDTYEGQGSIKRDDSAPVTANASSTATLWKNLFKGPDPPPLCSGHKEPCVLRTVKKKGPNMNKQFWACSRAGGHSSDVNAQCNFFLWASSRR